MHVAKEQRFAAINQQSCHIHTGIIILQGLFSQKIQVIKTFISAIVLSIVVLNCTNQNSMSTKATTAETTKDSTSGYAPVNGIRMYYEIHGKGEPVVLIHGGGSTIRTSFSKLLPLLAQNFSVIAVELQAHGHTSDRDAPESFKQDADDVVALLNFLKITKTNFVGFSNGGQTSMQVAISHPEFVNRLVLISAFYTRDGAIPGFFEGMSHATLENMPGPLKTAYLQINNDQKGLQTMFEKDRDRMINFQGWTDEDLKTIKAPTILIAGDHDVMTPEHVVKMSRMIPGAQMMILPGTHGSFIGEICSPDNGSKMPALTATVIKEFLEKK